MLDLSDAQNHPVLEQPWTYQIAKIQFDFSDPCNFVADLTLRKDNETVTLRFSEIGELEIEKGFNPWGISGMQILDLSHRGMETARIRVSSFEQDASIHFWAKSVECFSEIAL